MKEWKKTEEQLKKKLHRDYPVDDALWQAAEQQLDAVFPITQRKIGFYTMLIALGVTAFLASFSTKGTHTTELEVSTPVASNETSLLATDKANGLALNNKPTTPTSSLPTPSTSDRIVNQPTDKGQIAIRTAKTTENQTATNKTSQDGASSVFTNEQLSSLNDDDNTTKTEGLFDANTHEAENNDYVRVDDALIDVKSTNESPSVSSGTKVPNATTADIPKLHFPKKTRFSIETEVNSSLLSNGNKENNGDDSKLIKNSIYATQEAHVSLGVERGHWSGRIGLGRAQFRNAFSADEMNTTVLTDTIGTGYELVNREFVKDSVPVWLIKQYYLTDTNQVTRRSQIYNGKDRINYIKIPLSVAYNTRFDRFEFMGLLGVDLLLNPSLKTNFDVTKYAGIHQDRLGKLNNNIARWNAAARVGYRANYHVLLYTQLRATRSSYNVTSDIPVGYRSFDIGFGLNYRF